MRKQWKTGITLSLAVALGLTLLLTELYAQSPSSPSGKLAVLNVVRVFNEYQQTQDINADLDRRRSEVQAELDARDQGIEIKMRELEAFHPDSADFKTRRRDLMKARIDRENYMRLAEVEVRELFTVWTRKTYDEICETAAKIARDQGYDMVVLSEDLEEDIPDATALKQQIRLRKVIYANPEIDITSAVLERINQAYQQKGRKVDLGSLGP